MYMDGPLCFYYFCAVCVRSSFLALFLYSFISTELRSSTGSRNHQKWCNDDDNTRMASVSIRRHYTVLVVALMIQMYRLFFCSFLLLFSVFLHISNFYDSYYSHWHTLAQKVSIRLKHVDESLVFDTEHSSVHCVAIHITSTQAKKKTREKTSDWLASSDIIISNVT